MADTTVTTATAPSSDAAVSTTTESAGATSATTTATPPSSGESSTAPLVQKGISYEEVDKRFDAQLAKDAAAVADKKTDSPSEAAPESTTGDASKDEAPADEAVKTEAKEDKPQEPSDEEKAPPKVRAALKAIPDEMMSKQLKKELAENYYIAEAYKKSGMHLGDIHRYLEYGTLEDIEAMRRHTELLQAISNDFESGEASGIDRLNGVLRTQNPQAYAAWLTRAVSDLEETAPEAYQSIALQSAQNLLDHIRHDGQVENSDDHAAVAEWLENYLGLPAAGRAVPKPAPSRLTPDEERALKEANEIRAREQQRSVSEREAMHEGFLTQGFEQVRDNVLTAISAEVEKAAESYSPAAKQKLVRDIAGYVEATMKKHPTAHARVDEMVKRGGYTQQNFNAVVDYATKLATGFIPWGMKTAFEELAAIVGPQTRAREERVERQLARKEIGSGGAVPPPTPPRLSGKGKSYEEVDKEFDRLVNR